MFEAKDEQRITPRFSIVVPLYNKSSYILDCLQSVLDQTLHNFEIIVVDDGSSDDGAAMVESIRDHRITLIQQSNQGVSAARNRGALASKAPYVAFLDADDCWTPTHLERIENLIHVSPGRGLYSCAHAILTRGNYKYRRATSSGTFACCGRLFIEEYTKDFALVNSSTACLPRKIFEEVGGFPVGIPKGEDVTVWLRAVLKCGGAFDSEVGTIINRDADNRSSISLDGQIVYYLVWLDHALHGNEFTRSEHYALMKFAKRALVLNALGSLMVGDFAAFRRYRDLDLAKGAIIQIILRLAAIMPNSFIGMLRQIRHRARASYRMGY